MIPVLFERDEVDFQSNGIGQLPNVVDSYAYEIGNAEYELNLVYPTVNDVDGYQNSIWKELKVTERQILYKPSHSRKPHAFRIYNYEIDSIAQTITVYGRSRAYDLGNNVVKTVSINNQTPQSAMNMMKANLVEPTDFDFYSDMSTTSSTKWERQSGLSTIMGEEGSLIQYWGGEVLRENTRISLYKRVGKDNVTTLRLGKNIEQLNYDLRTDNMVTAIIPFYRYTPEGENKEEVVVTGNTVKSSKFNNYRLPYYQFVEYNEQDDNVTNLATLNNAASKWFSEHPNVDEPTLTINVDMVDVAESTEYAELLKSLEQVNVFDTVSVYVAEYDIDMVIKVVSLKYDGFNERNLEVELGSASSGLFETFVNPHFDNISKQLDEVRKIGVIAQISADGKNTNYQGSVDPNEAGLVGDDGDIYFRTVGTEKQMWQYQVNQWNLILDTSRLDAVEKEVSAVIAQAETDRTEAVQKINQAVIDSKVYADEVTTVSALRTKVLASDVITADMIQSNVSVVDKLFATDANVNVLTAKTAFISSVKAIDISADRVTAGTLNAANVAIINLNANRIATGTISGANSSWNLNTGLQSFTNPSTNDMLQLTQGQIQFQNGNQGRYLKYNAEGLLVEPMNGNTGTSLNTSLHLIGGAVGSHQYIQFASKSSSGILQRITALDTTMYLQHANNGGNVEITNYNRDKYSGDLLVGQIEIKDANNDGLRIVNNRIESAVRSGSHNIFITPQGTGSLIVGDRAMANYWNIHASAFLNRSTRRSKANIVNFNRSGLAAINSLVVSEFNLKQDLNDGINEKKVGFIAEDNLLIADADGNGNVVGINTYTASAYLVKSVQELDQKVVSIETMANASNAFAGLALSNSNQALSETQQLKNRVEDLEQKIKQLERAT